MSDEFFRTQMGQRFYTSTMPALVEQVKRVADGLERLNGQIEKVELAFFQNVDWTELGRLALVHLAHLTVTP